jgi:hypothetical protein
VQHAGGGFFWKFICIFSQIENGVVIYCREDGEKAHVIKGNSKSMQRLWEKYKRDRVQKFWRRMNRHRSAGLGDEVLSFV